MSEWNRLTYKPLAQSVFRLRAEKDVSMALRTDESDWSIVAIVFVPRPSPKKNVLTVADTTPCMILHLRGPFELKKLYFLKITTWNEDVTIFTQLLNDL